MSQWPRAGRSRLYPYARKPCCRQEDNRSRRPGAWRKMPTAHASHREWWLRSLASWKHQVSVLLNIVLPLATARCRQSNGAQGEAGEGWFLWKKNLRRDVTRPQSEVVGAESLQLNVQRGNVVNQPEIIDGNILRRGSWVNVERWEGELAGLLPSVNAGFDFGSPHEIGLVRRG